MAQSSAAYARVHYQARKRIGNTCSHCSTVGRVEAALKPDAPKSRLLLDPLIGTYFSQSLDDYFALCIPCHRRLDLVELRPTCRQGHPYTPENTSIRTNGSRRCLTCHRGQEANRLVDPVKRAAKNAADATRRASNPMTPEQKARKVELQRLRRQAANGARFEHGESGAA